MEEILVFVVVDVIVFFQIGFRRFCAGEKKGGLRENRAQSLGLTIVGLSYCKYHRIMIIIGPSEDDSVRQ